MASAYLAWMRDRQTRKRASQKRVLDLRDLIDCFAIELTQGKWALVDTCDVQRVREKSWRLLGYKSGKTDYACCWARDGNKRKPLYLHRFIMEPGDDEQIDHINGNGLDNRRFNLRIATSSENHYNVGLRVDNTSGRKGVCWNSKALKWQAQIQANGKQRYLGLFDCAEKAAAAYEAAAKELHGEYARLK